MHLDAPAAEQIAWAAGPFEGEGCITVGGNQLTVRLTNTDEALVDRFRKVLELGTVYGPYSRPHARDGFIRKPIWVWVAQEDSALCAITLMCRWLSKRRLARAHELTGIAFHVFSDEVE